MSNQHRPEDPADRWIGGRTEPGHIRMRTRFLYSEHDPKSIVPPGRTRHAFSRGGNVTSSDWPTASSQVEGVQSHINRAVASFGDDADLVITVELAEPATDTQNRIRKLKLEIAEANSVSARLQLLDLLESLIREGI